MEDELVQLDSIYQSPGFLLLAVNDDDERLGTVGVRVIDSQIAEIRRMFVRDQARGTGLGRSLLDQIMVDSRRSGFERLVLNTLPAMTEAISLYRSAGFTEIEPYVDEPLEGVLYFGSDLHL